METGFIIISEASTDDIVDLERMDLAAGLESPCSSASFILELKSPRTVILIARSEEGIVGYLLLTHQTLAAHIKRLLVSIHWRRRGIGSKLLHEAIDTAKRRKCCMLSLFVEASNLAARSLYKTSQFEEESRLDDYYGKGRLGLKLERKI